MAEDFRHPVWGQDTRDWRWWQHALCWALYLPIMGGIAWTVRALYRAFVY